MNIPIDDRNAIDVFRILRMSSGHGNIIENTEPHRVFTRRMMAGRTAKCIGRALTGFDQCCGRQGNVVRRLDRIPGAFDHTDTRVEGIIAQCAVDELRNDVTAQAACRPGKGQRGAITALGFPPRINGRQEIKEILAVSKLYSSGPRIGPSPTSMMRS